MNENTASSGAPQDGPPQAGEDEVSLLDLLLVLAKQKLLVLGLPFAAGVVSLAVAFSLPKIYTAQARILPPQQRESTAAAALSAIAGAAGAGAAAQALGLKNPGDLFVGILKGHTIADRMIERFRLKEVFETETMVATRRALARVTKISAGRDGLITIEVEDRDPKRAADMANAYIEELDRLIQVLAVTEAAQRRLFFERQLAAAREQLVQAEVALRRSIDEKGLAAVEAQSRAVVGTVERLRAEVAVKQIQLNAMRTFATERNPDMVRLRQEIASMQAELAKLEGGNGAPARNPASPAGLENIRLLRDVKYLEAMVELLTKQFEAAKIDEAKDAAIIQVVDSAIPPDFKSRPKRALIVLVSVLVAGLVAVLLAFIREALEKARRDPVSSARLEALRAQLRFR
ncbi:MAG: Wzz/FepE/Etk N-terminal domain-containing protein [Burkholderiales bacterium]|nr:Wzz/FepE/Etk N-terminal domain-containing protein [Burkholderiales bacterium]